MPSLPITGRCVCERMRYAIDAPPLFTHTCHCLDCQRKTGTAFAMTAIVMRTDLRLTHGQPAPHRTSERSTAHRCPTCEGTIYVESTRFPFTFMLRPGMFDDPLAATPSAHIWVRRKQAWLTLPDDIPQFAEGYDRDSTWPAASLARLAAAQR